MGSRFVQYYYHTAIRTYGTVAPARAEDTALRERNRSADAGGYTAGQSLRILPFVFSLPGWKPRKR